MRGTVDETSDLDFLEKGASLSNKIAAKEPGSSLGPYGFLRPIYLYMVLMFLVDRESKG